jgi:uncharacterized membrane protein
MAAKLNEIAKRSLLKSVTFRVLILTSDGIIVYALTHEYKLALTIVIIRNVAGIVIYYFHERIWNNINWGRKSKK